ncbi:hypothetical protein LTR03_006229 [Friedmanniomyces endolithicus]|nr:hypothetical protein LTR03_006229 [Friedmanniomyces endolithicus]
MNSSLRLSEQLSDASLPHTQSCQDTTADRSQPPPAKPSMEEMVNVYREESTRRRVAQLAQEHDQVKNLMGILAQFNDYIKTRQTESYLALLADQVEGMVTMTAQAAKRGDTKSVKRYCMLTTNAAAVGATMIFRRSSEEKQDKLRAAEERTAIRQQERWLRMKARHSFRLRPLGRADKVEQLAREQQERRDARERHREQARTISDFDAAVAQADLRGPDDRAGSARMREQPSEFRPAYFRDTLWKARQEEDRLRKRVKLHSERHLYSRPFRSDIWLNLVMKDLEAATPADPAAFRRILENVRLPAGVKAVFKGNIGEAILEIMQRTGSHLQILDGDLALTFARSSQSAGRRSTTGFQSLSLWGTPSENAAAIDLLPGLVDAVTLNPKGSRNLQDFEHTTQETDRLGSIVVPSEDPEEEIESTNNRVWQGQCDKSVPQNGPPSVDPDKDGRVRVPIRAVWVYAASGVEEILEMTAGDTQSTISFKRPVVWSTVVFTHHVETLTTLPPRLVRRQMRDETSGQVLPRSNTYKQQVVVELLKCFSDPSASACVSREAVDSALSFFIRVSDYNAIRQLLAILQENTLYALTTSNFDILLAAAAANDDMHNFRLWQRNMVQKGLRPSPSTWASLYRLVSRRCPGTPLPARVFDAMHEKGLFTDLHTLQEQVKDTVKEALTAHLARNPASGDADLDAFVSIYDKRFGSPSYRHHFHQPKHSSAIHFRPWLTIETANIMAKVLLSHGRSHDALAVLRMLEDSGKQPRADTLNTFLTAAYRVSDAEFAVSVVNHFAPFIGPSSTYPRNEIRLNRISYAMLFRIAWRGKCFNMLRVIWRYACCAGEMVWEFQEDVRTSVIEFVPARDSKQCRRRMQTDIEQDQTRLMEAFASPSNDVHKDQRSMMDEVWFGWAGKFIVGLADGVVNPQHHDTPKPIVASSGHSAPEDVASLPEHRQLTPHATEMYSLAAQPRSIPPATPPTEPQPSASPKPPSTPPHTARKARLQALFDADLTQTLKLQPILPLPELLEQAWKMDMDWHAQRLGTPSEAMMRVVNDWEATEEQKAEVFARMFGEMLGRGVEVPMRRVVSRREREGG